MARVRGSRATTTRTLRTVLAALVLLVASVCVWWSLRTPTAPAVLLASDPVARLILETGETEFALWTEQPQRLSATLLSLLGLDRDRLESALAETELASWFHRLDDDLGKMRVRQLAARQRSDGSWEVRLEVPPIRALLLRTVGALRKDPLLRGGRLDRSGVEVSWRRGIWTLRSSAESSLRAVKGSLPVAKPPVSARFDRRGAELLIRRRRTDGSSAIYGLCPPRRRSAADGTVRLSAVFRRGAECRSDDADIDQLLERFEAAIGEASSRVEDVFLVAMRRPSVHPGEAAAPAGSVAPSDALLVLEQESLPNVTQMPSACSVAWASDGRELPGAQLEGVLDVRVYEDHVASASGRGEVVIRAYDRPSEAACLELEPELRRLIDRTDGEQTIWVELDVFARWLDEYVRVLDEFRVLPRRWRGASDWVGAVSRAVRPGARLLFVERDGVWHWQVAEPVEAASGR